MDLMCRWFQSNLDIVFFIYGLAFVGMGIAIWVQPKKESNHIKSFIATPDPPSKPDQNNLSLINSE